MNGLTIVIGQLGLVYLTNRKKVCKQTIRGHIVNNSLPIGQLNKL